MGRGCVKTQMRDRRMVGGPRAAEVTLALKVIDAGGSCTPYKPIAGAGHARGRIWSGRKLATALVFVRRSVSIGFSDWTIVVCLWL